MDVAATQCLAEVQIFPEKVWLDSSGWWLIAKSGVWGKKFANIARSAAPNWVRFPPQATPRAAEVETEQDETLSVPFLYPLCMYQIRTNSKSLSS